MSPRILERLYNIHGLFVRYLHILGQMRGYSVLYGTFQYMHTRRFYLNIRHSVGVVGWRKNGLRQVAADLLGVDLKGHHRLDVGHVVTTEITVHQPDVASYLLIVGQPLDEGTGAIADADDCEPDFLRHI